MATDDMDLDLDIGFDEDLGVTEMELSSALQQTQPILSNPNDASEANAADIVPEKVHLRGLDNLTTADIRAFSAAYLSDHKPVHVEWIDDTSANLIYENADIARDALISFSAVEISDITQLASLQSIAAKSFPDHPDTTLQVRLAVVGDRKQAGARERSRFYLFNPEFDRAENRKKEHRNSYRRRDREDDGYQSRRYDDQEQRNRERDSNFDVNLYDDDADALLARRTSNGDNRPASSSSNDSRGRGGLRRVRFDNRGGPARELFPGRGGARDGRLRDRSASPSRDGRLRDRSTSPFREKNGDRNSRVGRGSDWRGEKIALEENRQKAQLIKAKLREAKIKKELFSEKLITGRLSANDPVGDTADLFAHKMAVPLTDGASDDFPKRFNIRGAASASFISQSQPKSFNIKGAAGPQVKELFPGRFGDNAGKELFGSKIARNKAADSFSR